MDEWMEKTMAMRYPYLASAAFDLYVHAAAFGLLRWRQRNASCCQHSTHSTHRAV